MRQKAFSLIELTLVLLIIAVLAGAVVLRVQAPLANAGMQDVVGTIIQFDRTTSAAARAQDRALRILVEPARGTLARADDAGSLPGSTLVLPDGFTIQKVLVQGDDVDAGQAAIPCSRRGLTPSYALLLEGRGRKQWVVVAGLSREMICVDHEKEAKDILAATGSGRHPR